MTFAEFFEELTGHPPYPYQVRLGNGPWPKLLDVPTGLGKTAAVAIPWLFKRLHGDAETPRRLIYCLPMRVLVEQTRECVQGWCERAAPAFMDRGLDPPNVYSLMGGAAEEDFERDAVRSTLVVGTQDMLLSRALNRGYGMSRYRWPMHFALLNNDCLWIFDETQLMGVGVETSAQMHAFRAAFGSFGATHSLWMSATLGARQLATVDLEPPAGGWDTAGIDSADRDHGQVQQRLSATKSLTRQEVMLDKATAKKAFTSHLVEQAATAHRERGGLTLVIVNRVQRAQVVYAELKRRLGSDSSARVALVHSRFRPFDRATQEGILFEDGDRIVVATQAIEAGVDVSAHTLLTELAPWPSLVQRFGRCNRYGADPDAQVLWFDVDDQDKDACLPYAGQQLSTARTLLVQLHARGGDAGIHALRSIDYSPPPQMRPTLRRRDLVDLFDTTPDVCGDELDISRYIRDSSDTDVQFFWREFDGAVPSEALPKPSGNELCSVSVASARKFLKDLQRHAKNAPSQHKFAMAALRYNSLERAWEPLEAERVRPGMVLLLHGRVGGYDENLGFTGDKPGAASVALDGQPSSREPVTDDDYDADARSQIGRWVELHHHLRHVRDEAEALGARLNLEAQWLDGLTTAAAWHDVGKAHPEFQDRLLKPTLQRPEHAPESDGPWAKSSHRFRYTEGRPHFRHELASALAWLQAGTEPDQLRQNLVAYLIAAHHGRIRLAIRSLPGEEPPTDGSDLYAGGIHQCDRLPAVALPDGTHSPDLELDLRPMRLGASSWLARMLALRDDDRLGPFRLAYLETLVRLSDWTASDKEQRGAYD
ncbi:MAG: CRISPR-associated endonuclease Cas3'' [Myxococcales bacterium]|nr:CRISPR-associated endonuclease Cas3'' [Myxococcales bacterium]